MQNYEIKVPETLQKLQEWFSEIITNPLDDHSKINPKTPSGHLIEIEAAKYINPSHTLKPEERIEIYNQQYWWRLLNTLHTAFPLLTNLLGYHFFNTNIGVPFLQKYPPNHWSLNHLGNLLPKWMEEEYQMNDRQLMLEVVNIDWNYMTSFFSKELPAIDQNSFENKTLILQPHAKLFKLLHNLLPFRDELIQEKADYWKTHPYPVLEKKKEYHFVIYRDGSQEIRWLELDAFEYQALSFFTSHTTLDQFCAWIEKQPQKFQKKANKNLHLWFQSWAARGLLGVFNCKFL